MERIEARVHDLPPREQVSRWSIAEDHDQRGHRENDPEIPARRDLGTVWRERNDPSERGIVECRDRERDREEVQPREVAGKHEPRLGPHDDDPGQGRDRLGEKKEPRHDQLGEVIAEHLHPMQTLRKVMEVPAERIWHGLGLVVVVETGQLTPAPVAAHLDQPRAELHAEEEPAHQHDEAELGRRCGRAKEDREEASLEQKRLPSERVEGLSDVHDREVEDPEQRKDQHRREREWVVVAIEPARDRDDRDGDTGPGDDQELAVRISDEMKEGRRGAKRDRPDELGRRQEAALAEQRAKLVHGHEERDQVDDAERALENETREPVIGRREPVHGAATLRAPWIGPPSAL